MKIRLGELRRIIREAISGPDDLAVVVKNGVAVVYRPEALKSALLGATGVETPVSNPRVEALISNDAIAGYVKVLEPAEDCGGAWELGEMWGPGYGDLLMDIAFALSPAGKLVPDRRKVSVAAAKMLSRTTGRAGVELEELPASCTSKHDKRPHLKKIYSSSGDPARLGAMKSNHQEVMDDLSKELGDPQKKLEAAILDAGWEKFNDSLEW